MGHIVIIINLYHGHSSHASPGCICQAKPTVRCQIIYDDMSCSMFRWRATSIVEEVGVVSISFFFLSRVSRCREQGTNPQRKEISDLIEARMGRRRKGHERYILFLKERDNIILHQRSLLWITVIVHRPSHHPSKDRISLGSVTCGHLLCSELTVKMISMEASIFWKQDTIYIFFLIMG